MSENIKKISSTYEQQIINQEFGLCSDCNQPKTRGNWCQICNSKRFQKDFNKWTSGNEHVDEFIQDVQLKARNRREVIEWIPHNRLRNIQYLAQGGFSNIYKAILLDGFIKIWDNKKQQWERTFDKLKDEDYENAKQLNIKSPLIENEKHGWQVVLKDLNNSSNINYDFLNEWKNYLDFVRSSKSDKSYSIKLYGITQDPASLNYIIVMEYMKLGDLRSNLAMKKYNPCDKYSNLWDITKSISALHKCNLFHGDFHSGNLLLQNQTWAFISDLGLSQPADKPVKSDEVYGVLPYIAPEVLRGKPYTKAADIYSFGIIMWEMNSGIPAFNNVPHDLNLALNICQGLRPRIVKSPEIYDDAEVQKQYEDLEVEYVKLMKRCWGPDPSKRPTAEELYENFDGWHDQLLIFTNNVNSISIDERIPSTTVNEPIIPNHPLSCYTSRKIDYSAKLNEILSQRELSSKITINDIENNDEIIISSESLENCKISSSEIGPIQNLDNKEKESNE